MIGAGDVVKIERNKDYNNDGIKGDKADFDYQVAKVKANDVVDVQGVGRFTYEDWQKQSVDFIRNAFMAAAQSNVPPDQAEAEIKNLKANLANVYAQAQEAEDKKKTLEASKTQVPNDLNKKIEQLKELLKQNIRNLEQLNRTTGKEASTGIDPKMYQMAGISPEGAGEGEAKAQTTMGSGQAGAAQAQTGAKAMQTPGFAAPANWGAQTAYPPFSTSAYMQSSAMEDNILSSFDAVLQNQNKGKQLMMLFFYFARMAESGDLGAMYQFMKFLTYIISKDKAKQQIDMGKKLIELQDLSRKWTDKLLGMQTNSTDPNSSNEFMKVMTQVKSETDAIATSQKLISQMMEEFSQIVETLTNTTKAALEANGRVLRTVSSVR